MHDIDGKAQAVLTDEHLCGNFAVQNLRSEGEPFKFPNGDIIAGCHGSGVEYLDESLKNSIPATVHAQRKKLDGQNIAVTINHQPRQSVTFPVNYPQGVRVIVKHATIGEGSGNLPQEKFDAVDRFPLSGDDTGGDEGVGIEISRAQEVSSVRENFESFPSRGVSLQKTDFIAENPRMAAPGATVMAGPKNEPGPHGRKEGLTRAATMLRASLETT
jgi:hypothetical protein